MIFILYIIAIVAVLLILTDVTINGIEWFSRIHIGQWADTHTWEQSIQSRVNLWLKKLPTITVTDNDRLILLDLIRGIHYSKNIQSWQIAGLLLSSDEASALQYTKKHRLSINDSQIIPETLFLAYSYDKYGLLNHEDKEKIAHYLENYNDKTIPYRQSLPHIRFVDTLGMVVPYLAKNGHEEFAIRQMEEYDAFLYKGIFPPHAYDLQQGLPLGIHDWSRGIGWYILALIECPELPGNKDRIIKLAVALLKLQKENGGFAYHLFTPNERMESSGTAIIGLLFCKAYLISKSLTYLEAAKRCQTALMYATRKNGVVDYCQGDSRGIGNYSRRFSFMPFAQGMVLYLNKELSSYA